MTLNILFLTIIIRKRSFDKTEMIQNDNAHKLYQQYKDKSVSMYRIL